MDHEKHWAPIIDQLIKNSNSNIGVSQSIDSDWIMNWEGAELMAYNYLCWNAAPLRKAQIDCITPLFHDLQVDIGDFVYFALPGYPDQLRKKSWVITGLQEDLDKMITSVELLEAWNIPVIPKDRYLLLEDGGNIFTEDAGEKLKLENLHGWS